MRLRLRFDLLDCAVPPAHAFDNGAWLLRRRPAASPRRPCGSTPGRNQVPVITLTFARREGRDDIAVVFGDEVADREFAVDEHGERRGLHPSDGEVLVDRRGCTRARDSCRPASRRGCARARRRPEVVFAAGLQVREAVANRFRRQRRDPEAAARASRTRRPRRCSERSARLRVPRRSRRSMLVTLRRSQDLPDDFELIFGLSAETPAASDSGSIGSRSRRQISTQAGSHAAGPGQQDGRWPR